MAPSLPVLGRAWSRPRYTVRDLRHLGRGDAHKRVEAAQTTTSNPTSPLALLPGTNSIHYTFLLSSSLARSLCPHNAVESSPSWCD